MKFLFDLLPIIVFFVAFKLQGIYVATAIAIFASFLQIGWLLARRRKVDPMMWVSLAIIVVFGGATLVLHDETFIKWKPTVLYWMFASVLLGAELLFGRNLIRAMLEKQVSAPEPVWTRLNLSWVVFFALMGAVNLYFAYRFPTEIWVNFKLFGALGMMFVFVLLQGVWLSRHMEHEEKR
jgi:intracellular septation protein